MIAICADKKCRLPTPEGFAPLDVAVLNGHLNALIQQYTLRGISVLVHCRGGVGRAGLIACCWMLKMGLCGWIRKIDRLPSQDTLNVFFNSHLEVSPNTTSETNDLPSNEAAIATPTSPARPTYYSNGITDNPLTHSPLANYRNALERIETVDLVERAIRVVRRRRSVKAIETFEQVHFLVQVGANLSCTKQYSDLCATSLSSFYVAWIHRDRPRCR
jgi:hypothetical protein